MKALIFFLVLLNVGYGGWNLVFGSVDAASANATAKISLEYQDVPELQLVGQDGADEDEKITAVGDVAVEEAEEAYVDQSEVPVDPVVKNEAASAANAQCWLLGPFDARTGAQDLRTRLRANGVDIDINKLATPIAPDYWVYVEPQVSRRAAVQLLRELQARKIDSFIVSEGELQNAISLGIFSKEESAQRVLAKHQGQDYPVSMTTIPRQIDEFWGVLAGIEYEKISVDRWSELQDQGKGFTMKQNFCDVVASTNILE